MGKKRGHARPAEWIEAAHPGEWIEAAQRWRELQETGHPPPGHPYEAVLKYIVWEQCQLLLGHPGSLSLVDRPISVKLVNYAASCWHMFPVHWWRIKLMPRVGYFSLHNGLKEVRVNEAYLLGELQSLQDCAASVLARVADLFGIDGAPIPMSTVICRRHFEAKSPFFRNARDSEQIMMGWPGCLEYGTTLTIDEQREAYFGNERVERLVAFANHPDIEERTLTLPDASWANEIILPAKANLHGEAPAPRGVYSEPSQSVAYPALGIEVDLAKKTVSSGGNNLEFARSAVQWHIFIVALTTFPDAFTLDAVWKDYPGEKDDVARQVATMHLNKKLARFGLKILERKLGKLPD